MRVLRRPKAVKQLVRDLKLKKKTVGFVPTMGFLHEGHLSLVRQAKKENDHVLVSIFVNPLQFGPKEDLNRYPRNIKRDTELLKKAGTDTLFLPNTKDMYGTDFQTQVSVSRLSRGLCGESRPTHFAGVATVVLKLLNVTEPDTLYLGQKDYQQFRVLEQMLKDLDLSVSARLMPIVRERDGIAMSSRNVLLTETERREAVFINLALKEIKYFVAEGCRSAGELKKIALKTLKRAGHARVDYIEIVDAQSLKPVVNLTKDLKILAAIAVYFSKTRLIDNILIKV